MWIIEKINSLWHAAEDLPSLCSILKASSAHEGPLSSQSPLLATGRSIRVHKGGGSWKHRLRRACHRDEPGSCPELAGPGEDSSSGRIPSRQSLTARVIPAALSNLTVWQPQLLQQFNHQHPWLKSPSDRAPGPDWPPGGTAGRRLKKPKT